MDEFLHMGHAWNCWCGIDSSQRGKGTLTTAATIGSEYESVEGEHEEDEWIVLMP